MVQTYALHLYFSDSNISYLTENLLSKIYKYDMILYFVLIQCKLNFERNSKDLLLLQIGLMILNDETLSTITFVSPQLEIQMFDIKRFKYRISLFAQKSLMGTKIIMIYSLHEYIIYRILDKIVLLTRRSRQFISTSFPKLLWPIAKSILFKYFYFRIVFIMRFQPAYC